MTRILVLIILFSINVFEYCICSQIIKPPPVKTIEQHGVIFDCVDFYKQPAFDNPLLKNHSIQRKPSKDFEASETYHRRATERNVLAKGLEECPEGSVPIRRITETEFESDAVDPSDFSNPDCHLAIFYGSAKNYLGVRGRVGIHSPQCFGNQFTGSFIAIMDRYALSEENMIAGWVKSWQLYGDDRSHFSIFWSNKATGQGCFDLLCEGFVQVDQTYAPGAYFEHVSIFNGVGQEVRTEIRQDSETKNWWVTASGFRIGYWPNELFSKFNDGAGGVFYGGIAIADDNHVSPQMGFGAFPKGLLEQAGNTRIMEFANSSGDAYMPVDESRIIATNTNCYKLETGIDNDNGFNIIFGGPGGTGCKNY